MVVIVPIRFSNAMSATIHSTGTSLSFPMEHYQEQAMILTFIRLLLRRNVIFSLRRMDGIRPPKVCIPLQVFRSKKKLNQHGHFFLKTTHHHQMKNKNKNINSRMSDNRL